MKRFCFITNKYPNQLNENVLVFVQQLVWSVRDLGYSCDVVCPLPINLNLKYLQFPNKIVETTDNGKEITVYFPKYIGFGQSYIGKINTARLTTKLFTKAVERVVNSLDVKPNVLYGHFITPAGIAAAEVGKKFNIPSFLAYGEATLNTINHYGKNAVSKKLESLTGVISVSTQNKHVLSTNDIVEEEKIGVFPNGYRSHRFYPRNKNESRKLFNLNTEKFIIAFVGSYDHRKGIERVLQAISGLEDVYLISAGKGQITISENQQILYNSTVSNEKLPYFLSAADAFVLPTLNEGCSNAIIEAMACGLPIISSNRPFNDDILDESNSIKIDPLNIRELSQAILEIKDNIEYRSVLAEGSKEKAKKLTLNLRAANISKFIDDRIKGTSNECS